MLNFPLLPNNKYDKNNIYRRTIIKKIVIIDFYARSFDIIFL